MLFSYLKNYKIQFILAPIFKLVEAVLELLTPLVMAKIIDEGIAFGDKSIVFSNGVIVVAFAVVGFLSTLVCQYFASYASQGFGTELREGLFNHVGTLTNAELDKFSPPTLLSRLTSDIDKVQKAAAMVMRLASRVPFLIIGAVIMSFIVNTGAAFIIIAVIPFLTLAVWLIMKKSVRYIILSRKKFDNMSRVVKESLDGTKEIRAFASGNEFYKRFDTENDGYSVESVRVLKISMLLNPVTSAIVNLGIVAILWYGGINIEFGGLTQGQLIALINYMSQITLALMVASDLVTIFTSAFASGSRIKEILTTKPSFSPDDSCSASEDEAFEGPVVCVKDLEFSFSSGVKVLEKVEFSINSGETVGVIGVTGSGKTVLLSLLPRLYDVSGGEIRLFGKDVRRSNLLELRKKVSLVPQNLTILSGTVRENMKLMAPEASDEDIIAALKIADAYDFVTEAGGLDYHITQNGSNLSGGQKRRLTIARALVQSPEMLILDDSFIGLDNLTECRVRDRIFDIFKKKNGIVIIASQRVETLKKCDKILVLSDGRSVGFGSHTSLLESCPEYREIYDSQIEND